MNAISGMWQYTSVMHEETASANVTGILHKMKITKEPSRSQIAIVGSNILASFWLCRFCCSLFFACAHFFNNLLVGFVAA